MTTDEPAKTQDIVFHGDPEIADLKCEIGALKTSVQNLKFQLHEMSAGLTQELKQLAVHVVQELKKEVVEQALALSVCVHQCAGHTVCDQCRFNGGSYYDRRIAKTRSGAGVKSS